MTKFSEKNSSYHLQYIDNALCLVSAKNEKIKPISIDFCSDSIIHRLKFGGGKSELIAKATLINKIDEPVIIDATAGMGIDSFIMASLGAKVHMVERSETIFALLEDALLRSKKHDKIKQITDNMRAINQDSYDYINSLNFQPDVIYLDPMFPERRKSASVKKEMVVFKDLLGNDNDADKLLNISISQAKKRVVVKRPIIADHLNLQKPDIIYKGKSNRFDVYLSH